MSDPIRVTAEIRIDHATTAGFEVSIDPLPLLREISESDWSRQQAIDFVIYRISSELHAALNQWFYANVGNLVDAVLADTEAAKDR